ncbi:MAG: hypothetical protein AAFQ87_16340 [Bacteroidota bacterium]
MGAFLPRKTLFSGRGWTLRIEGFADPAVKKLLSRTIWGTKGGIRYSHTDGLRKVETLPRSAYMSLWREDELKVCVGFVQKQFRYTDAPESRLSAYYIRYLAADTSLQAETQTGQNRELQTAKLGNRIFLQKFQALFSDSTYWRSPKEAPKDRPSLFYAYVTLDNERSANMVQKQGFVALRQFRTFLFSRFSPKKFPQARKIRIEERDRIEAMLQTHYQGYSYTPEDLRIQHDYYVWEESGQIVAGMQVQAIRWRIEEIPGPAGKLLLSLLPRLPYLRRILNPADFRFAGVDAVYVKAGAESCISKLWEHILSDQKLYLAMTWQDEEADFCQQYERLSNKDKGMLAQALQGQGVVSVFVRTDQAEMDAGLAERLASMPHYVAVGDVS